MKLFNKEPQFKRILSITKPLNNLSTTYTNVKMQKYKTSELQRLPPPPPNLGPLLPTFLGTLPLPTFCDFAVTSAFLAFFSSLVFLILSLTSLQLQSQNVTSH